MRSEFFEKQYQSLYKKLIEAIEISEAFNQQASSGQSNLSESDIESTRSKNDEKVFKAYDSFLKFSTNTYNPFSGKTSFDYREEKISAEDERLLKEIQSYTANLAQSANLTQSGNAITSLTPSQLAASITSSLQAQKTRLSARPRFKGSDKEKLYDKLFETLKGGQLFRSDFYSSQTAAMAKDLNQTAAELDKLVEKIEKKPDSKLSNEDLQKFTALRNAFDVTLNDPRVQNPQIKENYYSKIAQAEDSLMARMASAGIPIEKSYTKADIVRLINTYNSNPEANSKAMVEAADILSSQNISGITPEYAQRVKDRAKEIEIEDARIAGIRAQREAQREAEFAAANKRFAELGTQANKAKFPEPPPKPKAKIRKQETSPQDIAAANARRSQGTLNFIQSLSSNQSVFEQVIKQASTTRVEAAAAPPVNLRKRKSPTTRKPRTTTSEAAKKVETKPSSGKVGQEKELVDALEKVRKVRSNRKLAQGKANLAAGAPVIKKYSLVTAMAAAIQKEALQNAAISNFSTSLDEDILKQRRLQDEGQAYINERALANSLEEFQAERKRWLRSSEKEGMGQQRSLLPRIGKERRETTLGQAAQPLSDQEFADFILSIQKDREEQLALAENPAAFESPQSEALRLKKATNASLANQGYLEGKATYLQEFAQEENDPEFLNNDLLRYFEANPTQQTGLSPNLQSAAHSFISPGSEKPINLRFVMFKPGTVEKLNEETKKVEKIDLLKSAPLPQAVFNLATDPNFVLGQGLRLNEGLVEKDVLKILESGTEAEKKAAQAYVDSQKIQRNPNIGGPFNFGRSAGGFRFKVDFKKGEKGAFQQQTENFWKNVAKQARESKTGELLVLVPQNIYEYRKNKEAGRRANFNQRISTAKRQTNPKKRADAFRELIRDLVDTHSEVTSKDYLSFFQKDDSSWFIDKAIELYTPENIGNLEKGVKFPTLADLQQSKEMASRGFRQLPETAKTPLLKALTSEVQPKGTAVSSANASNQRTMTAQEEKKPTPLLDKLPGKLAAPTMTYAGIGSRETPQEFLQEIEEVASYLEEKGFTLRSGGALGADMAFARGVRSEANREIFTPEAINPEKNKREIDLAYEIHPNLPRALEGAKKNKIESKLAEGATQEQAQKSGEWSAEYVKKLMARNAYQIFGANLDKPVDFVLFAAPEGEGIRPSGGTGQAVEMARRKGIPTINIGEPNWRKKLDQVVLSVSQEKAKAMEAPKNKAAEADKQALAKAEEVVQNSTANQNTALVEVKPQAAEQAAPSTAAAPFPPPTKNTIKELIEKYKASNNPRFIIHAAKILAKYRSENAPAFGISENSEQRVFSRAQKYFEEKTQGAVDFSSFIRASEPLPEPSKVVAPSKESSFEYIKGGDILKSNAQAIVNPVNSVGVMGKGLALQFKNAYPENFEAYQKAARKGEVFPGKMFTFERTDTPDSRFIVNFPTKQHFKDPSHIDYISKGLESLVQEVKDRGIKSIAIPALGSGLGGLNWDDVKPLIEKAFSDLSDVKVQIFEPTKSSTVSAKPLAPTTSTPPETPVVSTPQPTKPVEKQKKVFEKPIINISQTRVSGKRSHGTLTTATQEIENALGSGASAIDMIESGFRTRATLTKNDIKRAEERLGREIQVGDVVNFFREVKGKFQNVSARITAVRRKGLDPLFDDPASWAKEGWRPEDIEAIKNFREGAAALEFELLNPPKAPPTTAVNNPLVGTALTTPPKMQEVPPVNVPPSTPQTTPPKAASRQILGIDFNRFVQRIANLMQQESYALSDNPTAVLALDRLFSALPQGSDLEKEVIDKLTTRPSFSYLQKPDEWRELVEAAQTRAEGIRKSPTRKDIGYLIRSYLQNKEFNIGALVEAANILRTTEVPGVSADYAQQVIAEAGTAIGNLPFSGPSQESNIIASNPSLPMYKTAPEIQQVASIFPDIQTAEFLSAGSASGFFDAGEFNGGFGGPPNPPKPPNKPPGNPPEPPDDNENLSVKALRPLNNLFTVLAQIDKSTSEILSSGVIKNLADTFTGLGVKPGRALEPGLTKKEALISLLGIDFDSLLKELPSEIISNEQTSTIKKSINKRLTDVSSNVFTGEETKSTIDQIKKLEEEINNLTQAQTPENLAKNQAAVVEKSILKNSLQKQVNEEVLKNIEDITGADFAETIGINDKSTRKIKNTGDTLRDSLYPLVEAAEKSGGFSLFDTFVGDLFLLQEVSYTLGMVTQTLGYIFVNTNAELEKYLTTLKSTLGTASEAKKVFQEFAQPFALEVPFFQTEDLISSITKLAAEGFSSREITGNISGTGNKYQGSIVKSIVDAAAAFGTTPEQATDAFISATQNRFTRIRQYGVSRADLEAFGFAGNNEDTQGAVNALRRVFEIRFSGIAESLSKTFRGALSNVQDFTTAVVRLASSKSFESIRDTLVGIASGATNLAKSFSDAAKGSSISSRVFKKYLQEDIGGVLDGVTKRFIGFLGFLNRFKAQVAAAISLTVGPFLIGRIATSFTTVFKGFSTNVLSSIFVPNLIGNIKKTIATGAAELAKVGGSPTSLLEKSLLAKGITKTAGGVFEGVGASKTILTLANATNLSLTKNATVIRETAILFKAAGEAATKTFGAIKAGAGVAFSLFKFSFINAVFEIIGAFDDLRKGIQNSGRVVALKELVKSAQETESLITKSINNIVKLFVENFDAEKAGPFISLTNIFIKGLNTILSGVEKLTGAFGVLYRAIARPFKATGTFLESVGEIVTNSLPFFDRQDRGRAFQSLGPIPNKPAGQAFQDFAVGGGVVALGAGLAFAASRGKVRLKADMQELKAIRKFFSGAPVETPAMDRAFTEVFSKSGGGITSASLASNPALRAEARMAGFASDAVANDLQKPGRFRNIFGFGGNISTPARSLLGTGGKLLGPALAAYGIYTTQEEIAGNRASGLDLSSTDAALKPLLGSTGTAKPNIAADFAGDMIQTGIATTLTYFITKFAVSLATKNAAVGEGAGKLAAATAATLGQKIGLFATNAAKYIGDKIPGLAKFIPGFVAGGVGVAGTGAAIGKARLSASVADRYSIFGQLSTPRSTILGDVLGTLAGSAAGLGTFALLTGSTLGAGAPVATVASTGVGYATGATVTNAVNKLTNSSGVDKSVLKKMFPGLDDASINKIADQFNEKDIANRYLRETGFRRDESIAEGLTGARDVIKDRISVLENKSTRTAAEDKTLASLKQTNQYVTESIDNLMSATDPLAGETGAAAADVKRYDKLFGISDETKRKAEASRRAARKAAGRTKPGDETISIRDRVDEVTKEEDTLREDLDKIESEIVKASLSGAPIEALQAKKRTFRKDAIDKRLKNLENIKKIIRESDKLLKENQEALDKANTDYSEFIEQSLTEIETEVRKYANKFNLKQADIDNILAAVDALLSAEDPKQRAAAKTRVSELSAKLFGKNTPEALAFENFVSNQNIQAQKLQGDIAKRKQIATTQSEVSTSQGQLATNIAALNTQEIDSQIKTAETRFSAGEIGFSEKFIEITDLLEKAKKANAKDSEALAEYRKKNTDLQEEFKEAIRGRGEAAKKMNDALEETDRLSKSINESFQQFGNASNAINLDTSLRQARLFNGLLAQAVENTDQFTKLENQRNEALGKAVDSYTKIIELRRKDIELVSQITRQQEEVAATTQFVAQTEALRKRGEALSPGTTEEDLTRFKTQSERISKEIARIQSRDADEAAQRRFRASIATMRQEVAGANTDMATIASFRQALADRFNAPGLADMSQDERMAIDSRNAETLLKAQELAQQRVAELQNQILDSQQKRFSNQVRFNELLREEKQIRADIVKAENDRVKSAEAYFRSFSRAVTGNENIGLGNEEKLFQTDFTTQISGVNQLFQAGAFKKDIRDALKEAADTVSAAREKGINVGTQVQQLIDANQRLNTLPEDQNPLLVRAAQTRADRASLQRDIADEEERVKRLINQRNAAQGIVTEITSLTLEQRAQVRRNVAERNPDRQARLALSNMTDAQIFNNAANVFSKAVDKFKESFTGFGGIDAASKKAFTGNQLRLQTDKPADAVLGKQNVSPTLAITSDMSGALLQPGKTVSNVAETLRDARDIVNRQPREQATIVVRNTAPRSPESDNSGLASSASYLSEAAKELKRVAEALKAGDASKSVSEFMTELIDGINNMSTNRQEKELPQFIPPPTAISATRLQESSFSQFMLTT